MTQKGSDSLIKKLVKSDITANRSYNTVIFVTIIATVCLMMIMPMFFQGKILEAKKDATGRWQAAFALVDSERMDKIKENPNIEAVGIPFYYLSSILRITS